MRAEEEALEKAEKGEAQTDAVQHEHGVQDVLQSGDVVGELRRPAELLQRDARVGLVERGLQFGGGVEGREGGAVGAARHVVLDLAQREGGVGDGAGDEPALAVVEDVHGVEVREADVFGDGVDQTGDVLLDGGFAGVDEVDERVGG